LLRGGTIMRVDLIVEEREGVHQESVRVMGMVTRVCHVEQILAIVSRA
jgi:hypothetical protein